MAYTTINKSTEHFFTKLWTGTNAGETISGIPFQPDFNWTKQRTGTQDHVLVDAVRGVEKTLFSNATDTEYTLSDGLTAWTSDGFVHGTNNRYCEASNTFVSWSWKAGTTSGIAGSPSITPTGYSFNTTNGFSIIKWTGTGANGTLPHGLGVKPSMIITKDLGGTSNWCVYHKSLGATLHLNLNSTSAESTNTNRWNDTEPTTTVFSVGTDAETNASGRDMVAYCFAEKSGYSNFGKYIGNGSTNGAFVYTGFKPSFVMWKKSSGADGWHMLDKTRDPYNVAFHRIEADSTSAEYTSADWCDYLSNGIKFRNTGGGVNGNGDTYIYMAFGQTIVGTNNTPATAR